MRKGPDPGTSSCANKNLRREITRHNDELLTPTTLLQQHCSTSIVLRRTRDSRFNHPWGRQKDPEGPYRGMVSELLCLEARQNDFNNELQSAYASNKKWSDIRSLALRAQSCTISWMMIRHHEMMLPRRAWAAHHISSLLHSISSLNNAQSFIYRTPGWSHYKRCLFLPRRTTSSYERLRLSR